MIIVVKAVHGLARCLGGSRQEVEADQPVSVSQLMELLVARHGEELARHFRRRENSIWNVVVFVNGSNVAAGEGGETLINDGDEVLFLSPISGG